MYLSPSVYRKYLNCPESARLMAQTLDFEEPKYEKLYYENMIFPDGAVDASKLDSDKCIDLLKNGTPLKNGIFCIHYNDLTLAAPFNFAVLNQDGKLDIKRVSLATGLKKKYQTEAAFSLLACRLLDLEIAAYTVYTLNRELEKEEYSATDITNKIPLLDEVEMKAICRFLNNTSKKDSRCGAPAHCDIHSPKADSLDSVYRLFKGRELYSQFNSLGITRLQDIPDDMLFETPQKIQKQVAERGETYVNQPKLKKHVVKLQEPYSFLDFEALCTAVRLFDGIMPYEHVPVMFSLHVQGEPIQHPDIKAHNSEALHTYNHTVFTAAPGRDPRREFADKLVQTLPKEGSIIVYNDVFESKIVKGLMAQGFLSQEAGQDILNRFWDLHLPFQKWYVYRAEQLGRTGLKYVMPAYSKTGYNDELLQDGNEANLRYTALVYKVLQGIVDFNQIHSEISAIERYCSKDTLGMIPVLDELKELSLDK